MRTYHLICLMGALVIQWMAMAPPARALDLGDKIDPLAQRLIDDGNAVGFTVGVFRNGEKQILAYGETKKDSGKKPTGRTVYEIGSATKAMTGILLADMVRRGELKLDAPLQSLLPSDVQLDVCEEKPITLEHVATHTSGLPRLPDNFSPANARNPYADYSADRMYDFLRKHKLGRAPGKYEYSNLAMGLLGYELARSRETTYEKLFIERIGKPLGMKDTGIKLNEDQRKRLAKPYDAALKADRTWDIPTLAGAGGLRSTAVDMLKFIEANLADDDEPLTQTFQLSHEKRHAMDDDLAMGLGWHIAGDGITRWHNGMTGGYASWVSVIPELNVGVVVLANTATMKVTELGEQLTRVACGIEVKPPKRREPIAVDAEALESYVGKYAITPDFALTVSVDDGKLMVQATDQQKFEVFAESPTEFFYTVVDAQLTFEPGKEGKAARVTLHQNGMDMKAERQE